MDIKKKELTIEEIKEKSFNILCSIDDFCSNNNIKYYLAYGTLLGAVRHKNFIPWDDDIDIFMFRKDYENFLSSFNRVDSIYKVVSIDNCDSYYLPFAKVIDTTTVLTENISRPMKIGVYVDIFVLDNCPGEYQEVLKNKKHTYIYIKMLMCKNLRFRKGREINKNLKLLIAKILLLPIKRKQIIKKIEKLNKKYNNKEYKYISPNYSENYKVDIMEKSWFASEQHFEFNHRYFPIPNGYMDFLKNEYGNYMELPPIEQRITHHDYNVYNKQ